MDDIRRPQHLKRRDYSLPAGRAPAPVPQPQTSPHPAVPPHHHTPQPPTAPASHSPLPAPVHHQPQPHPYHHVQPPAAAAPKHRARKFRLSGKIISVGLAALIALAAFFGAGYLLKGSSDSKGIPASITRQVNYDLFFPSPMPAGYTYMKDTATFQIGQVFYKFANGTKRVTVNEQPLPTPQPDLSKLDGYTQFQSPFGPAAIGTDLGEPTAVVVTPSTVITMHCIGGVSQDDLKTAIANLKNIGQNKNK